MESQLALFENPAPLPLKYRLFVGVFPTQDAVDSISNLQAELSDRFELRGKFRPRNHLHVTLHLIGDYAELSERTVEVAAAACAAAAKGQSSLSVTFDHVKSFRGRPGSLPFVLTNPRGNESLMGLHHRLITEMAKQNLARRSDFNFVPHVTLLYDRKEVIERPIPPVSWQVNEVVLILSYLGETKYDHLRCWRLSE